MSPPHLCSWASDLHMVCGPAEYRPNSTSLGGGSDFPADLVCPWGHVLWGARAQIRCGHCFILRMPLPQQHVFFHPCLVVVHSWCVALRCVALRVVCCVVLYRVVCSSVAVMTLGIMMERLLDLAWRRTVKCVSLGWTAVVGKGVIQWATMRVFPESCARTRPLAPLRRSQSKEAPER